MSESKEPADMRPREALIIALTNRIRDATRDLPPSGGGTIEIVDDDMVTKAIITAIERICLRFEQLKEKEPEPKVVPAGPVCPKCHAGEELERLHKQIELTKLQAELAKQKGELASSALPSIRYYR